MTAIDTLRQWWRQLVFDVPRLRAHAASRRRVLVVLVSAMLLMLFVLLIYGSILAFEYHYGGGWWGIGGVVVMYLFAFGLRRWMKKSGESITLSLSSTPKPSLRENLVRLRTVLATLVNRAAFEVGCFSGQTQPTGALRASQLQRLRREDLWNDLSLPLQQILASPEGSWDQNQTGRILLHFEAVRVLSWALREDYVLPSLRSAATVDAELIRNALAKGRAADQGSFLRGEAEIDAEKTPTLVYLTRLQNELIARGVVEGEVDPLLQDHVADYMTYAASIGDADFLAEDLPIGGMLISEAETSSLSQLRGVAAVRIVTLEGLVRAMGGDELEALRMVLDQLPNEI